MGEYARIASRLIAGAVPGLDAEEARRAYLETSGRSFRSQLRLLGVPEEKVEELARRFEEEKSRLLRRVKPDPLVVERLEALRALGLKVAVSTNNECRVVKELDWLHRLFDIVLCNIPEEGTGKGEPHLRRLFELGHRRCEILFVGDSDYDTDTYASLGVRVLRTRGLWLRDDPVVEIILHLAERGKES